MKKKSSIKAVDASKLLSTNKSIKLSGVHPLFTTAKEIIDSTIEENDYLIEGLMPRGILSILSGPSDTGKSLLSKQLVTAIAMGKKDFLGYKLNLKHQRAVYLSTEDTKSDWKSKLNKLSISTDDSLKWENLAMIFEYDEFTIEKLEAYLKDYPSDLIVIDVFADIFQDDLNNAIAMRKWLSKYSLLARIYGCNFLFIHHLSKKGESSAPSKLNLLGSMGAEAKCRLVMELRPDGSSVARKLIITKGNHLDSKTKAEAITLTLDDKTLEFTSTGLKPFKALEEKKEEKDLLSKRIFEIISSDTTKRTVTSLYDQLVTEDFKCSRTIVGEICKSLRTTISNPAN